MRELDELGVAFRIQKDKITRYFYGEFKTRDDAIRPTYMVRDKGVKDAFIVQIKDGKRMK